MIFNHFRFTSAVQVLMLAASTTYCQDVIFYDDANYTGIPYALNVGESVTLDLFPGYKPSWEIVHPWAAIKIEKIDAPSSYPSMFVFSASSAEQIGGTDQYTGAHIRVSCLNAIDRPQPFAWIPMDGHYGPLNNSQSNMPSPGSEVLVVRRAYIWENSEDLGCLHGPWGSLALRVYEPQLLTDFDTYDEIREVYCDGGDPFENFWGIDVNDCSYSNCTLFDSLYPPLSGGCHLHGPVYDATNTCCILGFCGPDPGGEWLDGPIGVQYSNLRVFTWPDDVNEVSVILREGDDASCDDFCGGAVINRNETGRFIVDLWHYGWVELENIVVPPSQYEESIDVADFYWMNKWDGQYFDGSGYFGPHIADQYVPLPSTTLYDMQYTSFFSIIPDGSTIGLLGRSQFPTGLLSRPMKYVAPCEPALFGP